MLKDNTSVVQALSISITAITGTFRMAIPKSADTGPPTVRRGTRTLSDGGTDLSNWSPKIGIFYSRYKSQPVAQAVRRPGCTYLHYILPDFRDVGEEEQGEDSGHGTEGAGCYSTTGHRHQH